jgi:hypothetical protein
VRLYDVLTWLAVMGSLIVFFTLTVWVASILWNLKGWHLVAEFIIPWAAVFLAIGAWIRHKVKDVIF